MQEIRCRLVCCSTESEWISLKVLFMIISPTRELASQTFQVAKPLFETLSTFSILRLVGGR